jgi:arylsulfatase
MLAALFAALALPAAALDRGEARRPHIVLMLSDNLGFGEIGVYGGGVLRGAPTPRLDGLAAEGMRFTNFNVELECTPSRSALLTGRMPVRSGTWRAASPGLPGGLAPWEITLAEMLADAGYDSAIFGKWHLGDEPGRYPTDQGFEEWWGFLLHQPRQLQDRVGFDPAVAKVPQLRGRRGEAVRQVEPYTLENRPLIDERIAEKSIAFIREHAGASGPSSSSSPVARPSSLSPTRISRTAPATALADAVVEHDHRVGRSSTPSRGRHRRPDAGGLRERQRAGLGRLPAGLVLGPLPRLSRQRLRGIGPDPDDGSLAGEDPPRKGQQRDRGDGRPLPDAGEDRGRGGSR